MNLRDFIIERDIRQCDFAFMLKIDRTYLSQIINGRIPSLRIAKKISELTNSKISVEDIMSGKVLSYDGKTRKPSQKRCKELNQDMKNIMEKITNVGSYGKEKNKPRK